MDKETRRLFLGLEMEAPWPLVWPKGRVLGESDRHVTLNFLGDVSYTAILQILPSIPLPSCELGPCGYFDASLELPPNKGRVIAWHINWLGHEVASLQKELSQWLHKNGLLEDSREWLSHLSVCRDPANLIEWKEFFQPLPCFTKAIHLYESLGFSKYESLWSHPFMPPFKEISHTADIAFHIYGKNIDQLYQHALIALAFKFPPIVSHAQWRAQLQGLDDVIILLNETICRTDYSIGCPFKAVSFHGEIQSYETEIILWEMIVDV